ncbi:Skp1 family, dimerization domain protein [Teladorsagia circumcincta]|uniref:Skp1 family, dimerization domain protein n=1 Tax=Teladorsagia circumcincta TaxID=45464 RepID=A0A2G9UKY9_TELCI|nr:Skp1 family, dimerization domain protein [Teladorsagia circumcincta]
MSKTIKTMISDLGVDSTDPIPICNVYGIIMKKVLDWCTYHKDDPPFVEDENKTRTAEICAWDRQFFNVDQGTIFELILAANYLDIRGLLDVACRVVASMINGKTPEEIRRTFNIKNDFTPEEEERIRKENAWRYVPYNDYAEDSVEELTDYYEKILRVSDELEAKRQAEGIPENYNLDGTAKVRTEIPPENVLKRVEYEEPPKGIEVETLVDVMRRLHSLTAAEMRTFLKQVHQSGQGTKKQLRARLRRYYRKEFSMYRMLHEGDSMPRFGNKTARHFDFLVAIDFECTCVEVIYDYPHEIIEFPAVLIDVRQMKIYQLSLQARFVIAIHSTIRFPDITPSSEPEKKKGTAPIISSINVST